MLEPEGRVLDVGCGTGLLMREVRAYYVGLDVSAGMLRKAAERRDGAKDLVRGDARLLPFRSKSFDACYSFTVLQNVPEPEEALKEIRRVCRKAVVSSLKGKGLEGLECEEVYPDKVCLVVDE